MLLYLAGHYEEALLTLSHAIEIFTASRNYNYLTWAYYYQACSHYALENYTEYEEYLAKVEKLLSCAESESQQPSGFVTLRKLEALATSTREIPEADLRSIISASNFLLSGPGAIPVGKAFIRLRRARIFIKLDEYQSAYAEMKRARGQVGLLADEYFRQWAVMIIATFIKFTAAGTALQMEHLPDLNRVLDRLDLIPVELQGKVFQLRDSILVQAEKTKAPELMLATPDSPPQTRAREKEPEVPTPAEIAQAQKRLSHLGNELAGLKSLAPAAYLENAERRLRALGVALQESRINNSFWEEIDRLGIYLENLINKLR